MLTDITMLMSDDSSFDSSNYFTNVFDAMKYKGGLYAIPTSVQFTNLWLGDNSLLGGAKIDDNTWSWQDFVDLTRPLIPQGGTALGSVTADRLLISMLDPGIEQFVDSENKKASFDSPEFKNLLTQAKTMIDEGFVSREMDMSARGKGRGMGLFENTGFRYMDEFVIIPQLDFNGKGAIYRAPSMTPNQGYSFQSNLTLSINEKSKNKEMAWEFLKFVLSDEIQMEQEGQSSLRGLPVSRTAFKQLQDRLKEPDAIGKGGKIKTDDGEQELNVQPPSQEQLDNIESYMTGIRTVSETDDKIFNLVMAESEPFFTEQKTVDNVTKSIQNKVETYLNE
jgi:multiple sugar transport system substrate-binding protein